MATPTNFTTHCKYLACSATLAASILHLSSCKKTENTEAQDSENIEQSQEIAQSTEKAAPSSPAPKPSPIELETPAPEPAAAKKIEPLVAHPASSESHASFSFVDLARSPNGIASELHEDELRQTLAEYFDIAANSPAGTEVTGKINFRNNFKSYLGESNKGFSFQLVEGGEQFELRNQRNAHGELFGSLVLKPRVPLKEGKNHNITVALLKGNKEIERTQSLVRVVDQTLMQQHLEKVYRFVQRTDRLLNRYKIRQAKAKALETFNYLEDHNYQLPGYAFYNGGPDPSTPKKELRSKGREYSTNLYQAAETFAGLAHFIDSLDDRKKQVQLSKTLSKAMAAYVDVFPLEGFESSKIIPHNDITHQWRYGDPLIGASIVVLKHLNGKISQDTELQQQFETLNRFHLLNSFSVTPGYRSTSMERYYLPQDGKLRQSCGIWGDANRHHRMRTWICQTALLGDYNRPITSLPWWYHPYAEWGAQNTNLLPQWEPQGSFRDLEIWASTNTILGSTLRQSGIKPDGSISHHTGERQDMAHVAYGFEWASEGFIDVAELFKGSHFEVSAAPFEATADFLSYTYPITFFKGSIDYQVAGRSHYGKNLRVFASREFAPAAKHLLELSPTSPKNEATLQKVIKEAKNGTDSLSGNFAMWANEFQVHRRAGDQPFYMSVKLQSSRTKGAEGFKNSSEHGLHNGSGVFQIKQTGDEYDKARLTMDWHALAGTTEELRTDKIPLSSQHKAYNPEPFAGTLSDHHNGLASFVYDREDPYASAKAYKSYFFQGDHAIFTGSQVQRSKKGQGEPIVTTIEQVEWDSKLTYYDGRKKHSLSTHKPFNLQVKSDKPTWFHHNDIAYVVLPKPGKSSNLIFRSVHNRNNGSEADKGKHHVFHLAVHHGKDPKQGGYRYVILANTKLKDVPAKVAKLQNAQIHNGDDHHFVASQGSIQASLLKAGTIKTKPWAIRTDAPALVQITENADDYSITLSDPLHDIERKSITLTVNRALKPGTYQYLTQGMEQTYVAGQDVIVKTQGSSSTLRFQLPDSSDDPAYAYKTVLYTGMPASITIPKAK